MNGYKRIKKSFISLSLSLFLIITFGIQSVFGYQVDLEMKFVDNGLSVKNKGVFIQVSDNGQTNTTRERLYLTDDEGIIRTSMEYLLNGKNEIKIRIDENFVRITEFESQNLGQIIVNYNIDKGEILSITGPRGKINIYNQSILSQTNYKLLLIYGFLTLCIITLFAGGRVVYTMMNKDISRHNRY